MCEPEVFKPEVCEKVIHVEECRPNEPPAVGFMNIEGYAPPVYRKLIKQYKLTESNVYWFRFLHAHFSDGDRKESERNDPGWEFECHDTDYWLEETPGKLIYSGCCIKPKKVKKHRARKQFKSSVTKKLKICGPHPQKQAVRRPAKTVAKQNLKTSTKQHRSSFLNQRCNTTTKKPHKTNTNQSRNAATNQSCKTSHNQPSPGDMITIKVAVPGVPRKKSVKIIPSSFDQKSMLMFISGSLGLCKPLIELRRRRNGRVVQSPDQLINDAIYDAQTDCKKDQNCCEKRVVTNRIIGVLLEKPAGKIELSEAPSTNSCSGRNSLPKLRLVVTPPPTTFSGPKCTK